MPSQASENTFDNVFAQWLSANSLGYDIAVLQECSAIVYP